MASKRQLRQIREREGGAPQQEEEPVREANVAGSVPGAVEFGEHELGQGMKFDLRFDWTCCCNEYSFRDKDRKFDRVKIMEPLCVAAAKCCLPATPEIEVRRPDIRSTDPNDSDGYAGLKIGSAVYNTPFTCCGERTAVMLNEQKNEAVGFLTQDCCHWWTWELELYQRDYVLKWSWLSFYAHVYEQESMTPVLDLYFPPVYCCVKAQVLFVHPGHFSYETLYMLMAGIMLMRMSPPSAGDVADGVGMALVF